MSGHILLIRLSSLGDVLLATPSIKALAEISGKGTIDVVTESRFAPILKHNPYLRKVITYDRAKGLSQVRTEIKASSYDLVVDLQNKLKSAAIRQSVHGAKMLIWHKRGFADLVRFVMKRPVKASAHRAEEYFRALASLGISGHPGPLVLNLTEDEKSEASRILKKISSNGHPPVAIHPGATKHNKRWPPGHVQSLTGMLAEKGHATVLLGTGTDAALAGDVKETDHILPLFGKTTIRRMAAVISRCSVLVCMDSAALHIASALHVPVVALFGPTDPLRWGPWHTRSRVLTPDCPISPCSEHADESCRRGMDYCMQTIKPSLVAQTLDELL